MLLRTPPPTAFTRTPYFRIAHYSFALHERQVALCLLEAHQKEADDDG